MAIRAHHFSRDEGAYDCSPMAVVSADLGIGEDGSGEVIVVFPCEVE